MIPKDLYKDLIKKNLLNISLIVIVFITGIYFGVVVLINLTYRIGQQYSFLAQSFLNLLIFYFCLRLARFFKFSVSDSLYLAFAFVFSSVYFLTGLVSSGWPFVQVVTTFLLFFALFIYLKGKEGKKNYFLIGLIYSMIFASRFTAGLTLMFFFMEILIDKKDFTKDKLKKISLMLFPVMVSGVLLLHYNFVRFGNYLENGYGLANNWINAGYEVKHGLFDLRYLPENFELYFTRLPKIQNSYPFVIITRPGVSFFVVSPIFLYVLMVKLKRRHVKSALVTVSVVLFFLLTYFYSGWEQIGPRYTLDFLPMLYIVLLNSFKNNKLSFFSKTLIILSASLNLYFIYTFRI